MRTLAAAAFVLAACALAGCGEEEDTGYSRTSELRVVGYADVSAPVDLITVHLGVETIDNDPAAAQAANDKAVRGLIAAIEKLGIAPADYETGAVSLDRRESRTQEGETVFNGYLAQTDVEVTLHDMKQYNPLITAALAAGVNRVSNLWYGCSTEKAKHDEARLAAIRDAQAKATAMAAALGKKLGDPLDAEEEERSPSYGGSSGASSSSLFGDGSSDERPTLAASNVYISSSVRIHFEIKD